MIYLVGKDFCNPFKVGRSGDPERRVKDIQTYTHFPVRLLGEIYVVDEQDVIVDDIKAEKEIHNLLSCYRLHNEWFQCSLGQFELAIKNAQGYYINLEPNWDDPIVDDIFSNDETTLYGLDA